MLIEKWRVMKYKDLFDEEDLMRVILMIRIT